VKNEFTAQLNFEVIFRHVEFLLKDKHYLNRNIRWNIFLEQMRGLTQGYVQSKKAMKETRLAS